MSNSLKLKGGTENYKEKIFYKFRCILIDLHRVLSRLDDLSNVSTRAIPKERRV